MAGPKRANVVLAKCHKTKRTFGIRVELMEKDWVCTWAFEIDENKAKREGYGDAAKMSGNFVMADDYPGCPYCKAGGFCLCNCGKIGCFEKGEYKCPWCGHVSMPQTAEHFDVSGGGY